MAYEFSKGSHTFRTSQRRGNNEVDYFRVSWERDTLEACGLWRKWFNSSLLLTLIFLSRAWFGGWRLKCLSHHGVKVLSEVGGNYSLLLTAEQYWFANPASVKWGGREDRQGASRLSAKYSRGDEGSESSPEFKKQTQYSVCGLLSTPERVTLELFGTSILISVKHVWLLILWMLVISKAGFRESLASSWPSHSPCHTHSLLIHTFHTQKATC